MSDAKNEDKPVRILNFRGTGEHDAKVLKTSSSTFVPTPSSVADRISYTISYPGGDAFAPDVTEEEFSKSFPKSIEKFVQDHLTDLQKAKTGGS